MQPITIIEYLFGVVVLTYLCGIFSVWMCELKTNILNKRMHKEIKTLENLRVSGAVLCVKTYKIREDYRLRILYVEKIQQLIFERVLFVKKSSLKNASLRQNKMTVSVAR